MKLKRARLAPVLIATGVILLVWMLRWILPDIFEWPERRTYDLRARTALHFSRPAATNLGFVYISDQTIREIRGGLLHEKSMGLHWPRWVYGEVVEELAAQRARVVGLDVVFEGRRPDHDPVPVSLLKRPEARDFVIELNEKQPVLYSEETPPEQFEPSSPFGFAVEGEVLLMESDHYFAWQLRRASNAVLAAEKGVQPDVLFATNALGTADISAHRDSDGVLRRAKAFSIYTNWHPVFVEVERQPEYAVDLHDARVEEDSIILSRPHGLEPIVIPIDSNHFFELSDFLGDSIPEGWPARDKAFTTEQVWHMGIVLAASELGLDLRDAVIEPDRGRIVLTGPGRVSRTIPVDTEGYFYINWEIPHSDARLSKGSLEDLLKQGQTRAAGMEEELPDKWEHRLVMIGSMTVGNDLTDRGATPLEKDTILVSKHWNVANSIIMNRFVQRSTPALELILTALLCAVTAVLTLKLRTVTGLLAVASLLGAYIIAAGIAYIRYRYWAPVILPGTGLIMTHIALVTWCVVFERAEQRRVKSIFSRIVSPDIVNELLDAEKLSLGGARREVTVLFADVRGFTEFTDVSHDAAAAYADENRLSGPDLDSFFDDQARETLATVNSYLSLVADMVKEHDGTLDKYIGDCVMAFWGAPVPNPRHALCCVRAAIDAQRAVYEFNRQRAIQNREREAENRTRASAGLPPRPMLPTLLLGSGINTGMATVGLMGSEAHISNYTVFGREVNLASRLETRSGRGRILISEATYACLLRDDPVLAATCQPLPAPQELKGFRVAVKVYEVPWRTAGMEPATEDTSGSDTSFKADTSSLTRPLA